MLNVCFCYWADIHFVVVLNAEKASYAAPILGNKLSRTRIALIKDVADTFC